MRFTRFSDDFSTIRISLNPEYLNPRSIELQYTLSRKKVATERYEAFRGATWSPLSRHTKHDSLFPQEQPSRVSSPRSLHGCGMTTPKQSDHPRQQSDHPRQQSDHPRQQSRPYGDAHARRRGTDMADARAPSVRGKPWAGRQPKKAWQPSGTAPLNVRAGGRRRGTSHALDRIRPAAAGDFD